MILDFLIFRSLWAFGPVKPGPFLPHPVRHGAHCNRGPETAPLSPNGATQLLGLEASNVSAWFSGRKVLERVSLHMEPGRVTALIGPSIYDDVASGLKLSGIKTPDTNDIVESSLRRVGLWEEVHRRLRSPGGALSGGQQRFVHCQVAGDRAGRAADGRAVLGA